ncbi:hypothetical protein [Paenibacillus sp. Marseille-Q4541]|uniref:hypothetical protein n=1 Tax=Paenibacillus sp. Marseille-Q4541 TaxID=2831522 RepID=UPI001BAC0F3C|nr:hypothetical protein [Paenibacillus sp. Marseille-Q4541]
MKKALITTFILVLILTAGGVTSVIASDHAVITPHQVVSALEHNDVHLQKADDSAIKPVLNHVPAAQYIVQSEHASAQPESISIFTYASAGALQDAVAELEQQTSALESPPVIYEHKNAIILHWTGDSSSDSLNGVLEEALLDL